MMIQPMYGNPYGSPGNPNIVQAPPSAPHIPRFDLNPFGGMPRPFEGGMPYKRRRVPNMGANVPNLSMQRPRGPFLQNPFIGMMPYR